MGRSDYRLLLDRGRKAGLNTSELYRALAGCAARASASLHGQADSNGFVAAYDQDGHAEFRPHPDTRLS